MTASDFILWGTGVIVWAIAFVVVVAAAKGIISDLFGNE